MEDLYRHIQVSLPLREQLRPCIMVQMNLAFEKGLPPMRPVFLDFEEDSKTSEVEDQFLFGSDLLVAPKTRYGLRNREVYLASSTEWINGMV